MKTYAALISYIGTDFCGWQMQGTASGTKPSVQSTLEEALFKLTQERPTLIASGRTDAGVHAAGQVVSFRLEQKLLPPFNILRGLNSHLPPTVRVLSVVEASDDFHAQHDAEKKQYSYYIQTGPAPTAALYPFTCFTHLKLDLSLMQRELSLLIGRHDFKAFQASGAKPGPTEREIHEADITIMSPGAPLFAPMDTIQLIRIRVVGSGFLKHMVRSIAGTLLEVGSGARGPAMESLLKTQDRSLIGATAEPQGLWLDRLWYKNLDFSVKSSS